jgi:hypothetical protein
VKQPLIVRLLRLFLLWLAVRALYFLYIASEDPEYRMASEAGFGPALWLGELLFAFLATGAIAGMWLRWRHTVTLTVAALGVYASILGFQLWQLERDPDQARRAYVASREARGLPVSDDRLDAMFSPAGRRAFWLLGAAFCFVPLAIVLWRRADFEPPPGE